MLSIIERQKFLKEQGFYTGNIDGKWGKLSKKATKEFQKSQHLVTDSIWGKNTDNKAVIIIKDNWRVGVVKFEYYRTNGNKDLVYIDENCLISKNFRLKEYMMFEKTIKKYKLKVDRNHCILYENLIKADQKLRDQLGSITINSGYRCPTYNKAISGSKNSTHTKGMASDKVIKGKKPKEVQEYIRNHYKELDYYGLESKTKPNCNQYTHADIKKRNGNKLVEF